MNIHTKAKEYMETVLLCKACHSSITHNDKALKDFVAVLIRDGIIDKDGNIIQ